MSNRDRIARAAAEAAATSKEKAAAKGTPRKPAAKSRAKQAPARVKVVWVVCDHSGKEVQTYPYPQEEAAKADAQQRTAATGKTHFVTRAEVPFA